MRALHIHAGNLFGGIERGLITLAKRSSDHEVALCYQGRLSRELEALKLNFHDLGGFRWRFPWQILRVRQRLMELIEERDYDVVLCHGSWSHALYQYAVTFKRKPLSVFWAHDPVSGGHWLERLAAMKRPDFLITNSNFTRSSLVEIYSGVPNWVFYGPFSFSKVPGPAVRKHVRATLRVPKERCVILHCSRMERWKGHEMLFKALSQIEKRDWECWVAGGAQTGAQAVYLKELRAQVHRLGLDSRVKFLGERDDTEELMAAADVFCQSNTSPEPFGFVLIEAMNAGLPIVTSAMGGPLESVTPQCGFLVTPHDVPALAGALEKLIVSPALRRKLAKGGKDRADELCGPEKQVKKLDSILSTLQENLEQRKTSRAA